MFKNTLRFFNSLNLPNFYELNKAPDFAFSQSNIFHHACATPLTILMSDLENNNYSKSTYEAVNKLSKIINTVSNRTSTDEEFNIVDAINEVVCLLNGKIGSNGIDAKVLVDDDLNIFGNKIYFQEALSCILNNAVEAYGHGKENPISMIVRKVDAQIKIDVVDYAFGMSLIKQKLVFLTGFSTKETGSGLGLPFAKKTIEKMFNGKMKLKSVLGMGTHVSCCIPLKLPYSQNPLQF